LTLKSINLDPFNSVPRDVTYHVYRVGTVGRADISEDVRLLWEIKKEVRNTSGLLENVIGKLSGMKS
jgi:hypothetical protein